MASDTKAVFISYRRDAGAGYAGRIADALVEHFGEDKVFRDIDSLEPGLDFVDAVERAIESSEVLIAVVGKHWLTVTDAAGQKRLENPDDYVRTEIAIALKRNIRVIPLLIQEASMPSEEELPDDLAPLSRRNAFVIHDSSWRDDIQRLVTALDRAIKGDRAATPDEPGEVKRPEAQPVGTTQPIRGGTQPIRQQSRSSNVGLFLTGALVVCLIVLIWIFFRYLLPAIQTALQYLPQ
jgi:TIR domain